MNFRQRFMYGLCDFDAIDDAVAEWHESAEYECELHEYLGLTEEEYSLFVMNPTEFGSDCFRKGKSKDFGYTSWISVLTRLFRLRLVGSMSYTKQVASIRRLRSTGWYTKVCCFAMRMKTTCNDSHGLLIGLVRFCRRFIPAEVLHRLMCWNFTMKRAEDISTVISAGFAQSNSHRWQVSVADKAAHIRMGHRMG